MIWAAMKVALLAVIGIKLLEFLLTSPVNVPLKKHNYPGTCRVVDGLNLGSEDFQVTNSGLAFVTSGVWFPTLSAAYTDYLISHNVHGSISLYDFHNSELGARQLSLLPSPSFNPATFHPHGISLLEDNVTGQHLLYVINHRCDGSGDAIEKFTYLPSKDQLVHTRSFSGKELRITNDLAVVEEDKFFVTNFLYFSNYYLGLLEPLVHKYLPIALGSVLFFDGSEFKVVDSNLNAPNGITLSKDKRFLYVNLPRQNEVYTYEVKSDFYLNRIQIANIHTSADNPHLSLSGDALYVGAHPVPDKVKQHLKDPRNRSPSLVLRLPLKDDGTIDTDDVKELFYDHGDLISASSVAAVYGQKLLIGSVIDTLVVCDVTPSHLHYHKNI